MKKLIKRVLGKIIWCYQWLLFTLEAPKMRKMMRPVADFAFNYHSQNGEDGIIEEIMRRLSVEEGWAVEFGAWDGIFLSNTFRLVEKERGWKAVYIEGDKSRFKDLQKLALEMYGKIIPLCAFVTPQGESSLENLLKSTPVPRDFDLLSIDVDSIDYQIWQSLHAYKPKVVVIEINSFLPATTEQIHDIQAGKQGSSFLSTLKLGNSKGYTLLCHTGNLIFVRNDLLQKVESGQKSFADQVALYNPRFLRQK